MDEADYKILYDYFLGVQKNYREETIQLLKDKKFSELGHSRQYIIRNPIRIDLEGEDMEGIMRQLQSIKNNAAENHSNFRVLSGINWDSDEEELYVMYFEFLVADESKCESLANHYAKNAIWKVKYQSEGKDAKATIALLNKLKASHE
jgi:hypothetical protein